MTDLGSALLALADRPRLLTSAYQRQKWQAVVEGAHPDILEFRRCFIDKMAKEHGVPMWAHNMVRTREEQEKLFAKGVSKSRGGNSPHNFGMAVDLVHSVKAWDLDPKSWAMIGHIGFEVARAKGIALRWGGDWGSDGGKVDWDPAHWEILNWKAQKVGYPNWANVRKWVQGKRLPLSKVV